MVAGLRVMISSESVISCFSMTMHYLSERYNFLVFKLLRHPILVQNVGLYITADSLSCLQVCCFGGAQMNLNTA
jgi:branched-subunit amino acid transport protein AzlD